MGRRATWLMTSFLGLWFIDAEPLCAQSSQIRNPIISEDALSRSITGSFGVDVAATSCIDGALGEFELPQGGCSAPGLCFAFKDIRNDSTACLGEGLSLDLRAYADSAQVDTYRVVFAFQDYPVVFRWPANLQSYYDSLKLVDELGGSILNVDMMTRDSLELPAPTVNSFLVIASGPRGVAVGIVEERPLPAAYALWQNYPNPFNPVTTIAYDVPARSRVRLTVFSLIGEEVAMLVDGEKLPGHYEVAWDGMHLPSGVYFCRMEAGRFTATRRLILLH